MQEQEQANAAVGSTESKGIEVTPDDHDAGYKDVEVTYKSGRTETVRLTAIPARRAIALLPTVLEKIDPWRVLIESLPKDKDEQWIDRLSVFSSPQLLGVAWALAFGTDFQKKIQVLGEDWLKGMTAMASDAPS